LEQYGIKDSHLKSALRLNSLACVALPTCGLSLAEAERYLPDLLTNLRRSSRKTACATMPSPSA
jgi:sulfite reductase (NADPH) hemoprotein beta-component